MYVLFARLNSALDVFVTMQASCKPHATTIGGRDPHSYIAR
jgi:hypothetical protein